LNLDYLWELDAASVEKIWQQVSIRSLRLRTLLPVNRDDVPPNDACEGVRPASEYASSSSRRCLRHRLLSASDRYVSCGCLAT
jgi:hypothetical protein